MQGGAWLRGRDKTFCCDAADACECCPQQTPALSLFYTILAKQSQVGLLVSDTAGNTAAVRKTFSIAAAAPAAGGGGASVTPPAGASSSVNLPPVIKADLAFAADAPGAFAITGVVDPDGDDVAVKWTLMEQATGATRAGTGRFVQLPADAAPGAYQLLITAADGRGGVSEAVARVDVRRAAAAAKAGNGSSGSSTSQQQQQQQQHKQQNDGQEEPQRLKQKRKGEQQPPEQEVVITAPPSIYGAPLAARPSLPRGTFYQGAVLDADASTSGLFDLTRPSWRDEMKGATCVWRLEPDPAAAASSGGAVGDGGGGGATVYGCAAPARFRLHAPGAYRLTLEATPAGAAEPRSASSAIVVKAKPGWGDYYSVASPEAFATGRCGPGGGGHFAGLEFAPLALSCRGVSLPPGWGADMGVAPDDADARQLTFSWRLTPLTARAAAAHASGGENGAAAAAAPLARSTAGARPALFGAVAPGLYAVELTASAGGAGGGSAASVHAVYRLATTLVVEPTATLRLPPPPATCAGRAVRLAPAALALLPGQRAAPARWSVEWADARAATGAPLVLTGSGSSFSLSARPGRYVATVTVDVTDAGDDAAGRVRRLTGRTTLEARPCLKCSSDPVVLRTLATRCAASGRDAAKLLATPRPAWLRTGSSGGDNGSGGGAVVLEFAPGSDLTPGAGKRLTVVARTRASNLTAACTHERVTIRDATPPAAKLARAGGECLAPANGRWACFAAGALVRARDACGHLRPPQYRARCAAAALPGACRALPDGRVCVRAELPPGGDAADAPVAAVVEVLLRDGFGNAAPEPLSVPVTVLRRAAEGCAVPRLELAAADE